MICLASNLLGKAIFLKSYGMVQKINIIFGVGDGEQRKGSKETLVFLTSIVTLSIPVWSKVWISFSFSLLSVLLRI